MNKATSGVENAEVLHEGRETTVTSKGEERYAKLGATLKGAASRLGGWMKDGANAMGRMFKGAAVGVLSTPEAVAKGAEAVSTGVKTGVEYADKKFTQGAEYVYDQADKFDAWRGDKAEQMSAWTAERVASVKEFAVTKGEQVQQFATEKMLLAGTIASLAKNKTVEGFQTAKEGLKSAKEAISSRFTKLIEWGKNAYALAKFKGAEARMDHHAYYHDRAFEKMQAQIARMESRMTNLSGSAFGRQGRGFSQAA